ncbi:hypothetical protein J1605_000833 [Eschrichtius robustus]|uniref:Uncharacterized protein n=1 Tax=Eschrichtius robustus TaxID=9764 RepID=A0AB34GQ73_ESCRO|nr:hypothetical protein J1605_000833 [Eschrichtius robustus]
MGGRGSPQEGHLIQELEKEVFLEEVIFQLGSGRCLERRCQHETPQVLSGHPPGWAPGDAVCYSSPRTATVSAWHLDVLRQLPRTSPGSVGMSRPQLQPSSRDPSSKSRCFACSLTVVFCHGGDLGLAQGSAPAPSREGLQEEAKFPFQPAPPLPSLAPSVSGNPYISLRLALGHCWERGGPLRKWTPSRSFADPVGTGRPPVPGERQEQSGAGDGDQETESRGRLWQPHEE